MLALLAGGTGAAKFLEGLAHLVPPEELTVIVNTGDDATFFGLHVSPDIDAILYTLAGLMDEKRGWGIAGDTFHCLEALERLGEETWFRLGDQDFATHLRRTLLLRQGMSLSQATATLARSYGLRLRVFPMTDDPVATKVVTPEETLDFQEYFAKRQAQDRVMQLIFAGAASAQPAPGVLEALHDAEGIILGPSNPLISIGPIAAIPGMRQALRKANALVLAISPIVGGRALKGPADRMMRDLGLEASAFQVAALYRDFVDIFVLDTHDEALAPQIEGLGLRVVVTDTIMGDLEKKKSLARVVLKALGIEQG